MDENASGNEIENGATANQDKQSNNTLTLILGAALILALAAIAFLLLGNFSGVNADSESEGETAPPTEVFPSTPEEPSDLSLEGTDWILAGTIEGTTISLTFAGDSLSGFAGCNTYNAGYNTSLTTDSSNSIAVGPIASGRALCEEQIMNQEQNYLANLESATSYTISGNTVNLTTEGGPLTFGAAVTTQLPVQ
ncbi:MAG: META domain-containing protein [Chloroflexota bacterium]|jgi:heat shock protein HslJ